MLISLGITSFFSTLRVFFWRLAVSRFYQFSDIDTEFVRSFVPILIRYSLTDIDTPTLIRYSLTHSRLASPQRHILLFLSTFYVRTLPFVWQRFFVVCSTLVTLSLSGGGDGGDPSERAPAALGVARRAAAREGGPPEPRPRPRDPDPPQHARGSPTAENPSS